jgi:hypothetical protein
VGFGGFIVIDERPKDSAMYVSTAIDKLKIILS